MPSDLEPHLSLVIPAYNEATRLPQSLRKIIEAAGGFAFSYEVLVIVEESTDGTLELAREVTAKQANFQIIDNGPQRGKGHAVRSGSKTQECLRQSINVKTLAHTDRTAQQ